MKARAFWVTGPGVGEIKTEAIDDPSGQEIRVRTLYSGVSRGTETLVFQGRVPASQHQRMKCPFQVGQFGQAVKYGYISVGRVESDGDLAGRNVVCLHPHQDRYVVPRSAVTVLPEGFDPAIAVLAPNMETAVNGVWDCRPQRGDRVTVIGAGVVGALVAWRMQAEVDHPVQLVDLQPSRAGIAEALGLSFAIPADAWIERNLVVHASGSPAGLRRALELAGDDGRIVEMSWFGDRQIELPLGEAFHSRRLTIQCSQVGALPPHMRDSMDFAGRMRVVLDALSGHPELRVLINSEGSFESLPQTMKRLAEGAPEVLCHRVRYQETDPCTD